MEDMIADTNIITETGNKMKFLTASLFSIAWLNKRESEIKIEAEISQKN